VARSRAAAALALYLGISILFFGIPIAAHPGRDWIGTGADPQIFVWSLAWWPHAVLHWQNPILTHAVWPPVGLDLTWISSVPGLAALLAPVTLAAGPVAAYNVASLLVPTVCAWTAFLLCRRVTRAFWPSLAGGYLFGFSSYVLGQLQGHLHASSVFLVPLVALVVLRFVEGTLDGRGLALRLAALLVAQLLLSTEVLFTLTVALVLSLVCAFAFVPDARSRLRRLPTPIVAGYFVAGVAASPFLAYAFAHFEHDSINDPRLYTADLLNLVVPTPLTAVNVDWARRTAAAFIGNTAENGAYLGTALLAIVVWYAWQRRRDASARWLVLMLAIGIVAELGPYLRLRGASYAPLPWKAVVGLPVLDNVLPARFSMFVALAAAVIAASWAAGRAPRWARAALPIAAIVLTVPAFWQEHWHEKPDRPAFFTTDLDRACLPPEATVLALPTPAVSGAMLWQAEAGFRFRLATASLSPVVPRGLPDRATAVALGNDEVPPGGAAAVLRFAAAQRADAILVDPEPGEPWRALMARTGRPVEHVGGVDLYPLSGRPGCRLAQ
jgi:hypothetical protein